MNDDAEIGLGCPLPGMNLGHKLRNIASNIEHRAIHVRLKWEISQKRI